MSTSQTVNRVRVEHGVYLQPNGRYAVCFMLDGRPRFAPWMATWTRRVPLAPGLRSPLRRGW